MTMTRKWILAAASALLACWTALAGAPKIEKYVIIYSAQAEDEEGMDAAVLVQKAIRARTGVLLPVFKDREPEQKYEILVGNTNRPASASFYEKKHDDFDWKIVTRKRQVVVTGGGCWALLKAARVLGEEEGWLEKGWSREGNVYGEFLFPRTPGSNLRILDDNIWQFDSDKPEKVPSFWKDAGLDCRNRVRYKALIELVHAYLPDVVCLQEYSKPMDGFFRPAIEALGYAVSYTPDKDWNYTPVFYRKETVELTKTHFHSHQPSPDFNNHGTKTFNYSVFTLKENGKPFIVGNTHLWWKSEKAKPGSNEARASQVRDIMGMFEREILDHDCPVFLMGDMNCRLAAKPMRQLTEAGYVPVWRIATVFGDGRNGHHMCGPKVGFSRKTNATVQTDGVHAIDHFLLWNDKDGSVEVKVFERIYARFTVPVTDHYPNYMDALLR